MKISEVSFIKSAASPDGYPSHQYPEIAIAGRSNVGKSSLINKLTNRKKLAITSSTPGRTRLVNFFLVDEFICLVDLPGYGYAAKASKTERAKWGKIAYEYLDGRMNLKAVIAILDLRRGPTDLDLDLQEMLIDLDIQPIFVGTKVDKLKRSERKKMLKLTSEKLKVSETEITPFSAVSGEGRKELWAIIVKAAEK